MKQTRKTSKMTKAGTMSRSNNPAIARPTLRKLAQDAVCILLALTMVFWQTPVYAIADEVEDPQPAPVATQAEKDAEPEAESVEEAEEPVEAAAGEPAEAVAEELAEAATEGPEAEPTTTDPDQVESTTADEDGSTPEGQEEAAEGSHEDVEPNDQADLASNDATNAEDEPQANEADDSAQAESEALTDDTTADETAAEEAVEEGEEVQNEGLTIFVNARDLHNKPGSTVGLASGDEVPVVQSGDTVYFEIESALSDAETRGSVDVDIKITPSADCGQLFFDKFTKQEKDGNDVIGYYNVNKGGKSVRLYLKEKTDSNGNLYYVIAYTLKQGETIDVLLSYRTATGIVPNGSSVSFEVETNVSGGDIDEEIKLNGKTDDLVIYNTAELNWSKVSKSADIDKVKVIDGKVQNDIIYTLHSESLAAGKGVKYAELQQLTDTFDFPEGFSLAAGEGEWSYADGTATYSVNGNPVLTFAPTNYKLTDDKSAAIEVKGNGFTFTRATEDNSKEMPPLDLVVTLHKEGIAVSSDVLDSWPEKDDVEIVNTASLTVSPDKDNPQATGSVNTDSDPVVVTVDKPEYSIELKKTVDDDLILISELPEDGAAFTYTITATNKTDNAVSGVTITDDLPKELMPAGSSVAVSDGSNANIEGNTVSWTGSLPAKGKISLTIPVTVTKETAEGMESLAKQVVNNTAVVQTPDIPGIEASVPVTLWNPKDISPAVVTKTPVLLGSPNNNNAYVGVYDLSYKQGDVDKYLDVSADTVMYYMVTLYNPNDSQQTYNLSDKRGNGGYYGSENFLYTTAPDNVKGLFSGTKYVVPTKRDFTQNDYWYGYKDPDGNSGRNYSVGLMEDSKTTGDAYKLLSGNGGNVSATITVNPKSYTYVFIPFQVKSGIYTESGVTPVGPIGGDPKNGQIKTIPSNTVTTTNTDPNAPDGPEQPTATTSALTPIGKLTPSVDLVKALVSPLNSYAPVTSQSESHSNGEYVYYKITINNKTTAGSGNSVTAVPFQFLDVLPPYLKVDVGSYSYGGSGPSVINGNNGFFSSTLASYAPTVVESNSNGPANYYGGGRDAVDKAKNDAFYLQYAASAGTLKASVYTYKTNVSGKTNDAVYVMIDSLPANKNAVSFYIRCKVVEYDKARNWDLATDTQSSNYGQVGGSTTGEAQSTNSVYIPTQQEPAGKDDHLLVKTERFKKYVISPDYHDAVMEQLQQGLDLPTLYKWEQNGYLLSSLNVLPGQELDYLLVYTTNSNRYKNRVYGLVDTLPSITKSNGDSQAWVYNPTGNLTPGQYVVRDVTGSAFAVMEGAEAGTKDNPSIGKVHSAGSDKVQIGWPVVDTAAPLTSTENDLAINIVSLKLPEDISNMTFENTLTYESMGLAPDQSTVTHAIPGISKGVSNAEMNSFANQTTYTISAANFSNVRARAVSVVDDLSAIREYFTVDDISLAAFAPKDASGSAIQYHVVLTDIDGTSYTVPYKAISEGASFAEVMAAADINLSVSSVAKVVWNFWPAGADGADTTVASFDGTKGATVTVGLKEGVKADTTVSNTATITYTAGDSKCSLSDSAEVKVTDDPGLEKTMKVNGEDVMSDNDDAPLRPGDKVEFTVTFTNTSGVAIPYANIKIHDTLAKGLKQNCEVVAETDRGTLANKGVLKFVDGEADITFTGGKNTLANGGSITITYSVEVAESGGTIQNTVKAGALEATTPTLKTFEYAILDARLQKGVEAIGNSDEQLHVYDMNASDRTITYNAVVYNGSTSTVNLPVSFLYDQLPDDFSFVSMSNGKASETYTVPSGWTSASGSAKAHAGSYEVSGTGDEGAIKFNVSQNGSPVTLAPGEYITFSYVCTIDQDARYSAYTARAEGDDFTSLNSLYLAVDVDGETADRLVLKTTDEKFADNSGKTEADKNYGDCALVENGARGSLDAVYSGSVEGWLQSDVSVTTAALLNPDVGKETTLHRAVSSDASVTPKSFDVYNGTKVFNAEETNAVKWEVSIDNTQGQKDVHNYTISEVMPQGFSFITNECDLYGVNELDASGKVTGYRYNDVVFTLYNAVGEFEESAVVPVEGNTFNLADKKFDVPCGYKAVVSYWGYYAGAGVLDGSFTNTATVKFSEKVDGPKRVEPGQADDDSSITVSDTFESIAGYATDSVKQIILDGAYVKVDPQGDYSSAGYVEGDYSVGGDDSGNGYGDSKANGYGDRADNYVVAATNGDKVGYTLNIRNDSSVAVDEMVIIDKLPYKDDNGTNNQDRLRHSQFSVLYDTESDMVVEITDGLNGKVVGSLDASSYVVLFSDKTGYTASEWNGSDVSASDFASLKAGNGSVGKWHTRYKAGDVSFRVLLRDGFTLQPGQYVRVYFKGAIDDEAEAGQIAWNSFGYRYKPVTRDNYILAAEPAKVGVVISSEDAVAYIGLNKKDEANKPVAGAVFNVYEDAECKGEAVGSITTGQDGVGISTPITMSRSQSASNIFYVKEASLDGYKANNTVYEVQLTEEDKVYKLVAKNLFDSLVGSTVICSYDDANVADKVKASAGTITNESIVVKVAKVDEDGTALSGAKLQLKRTDHITEPLDNVQVTDAKDNSAVLADDKITLSFTTAGKNVLFTKLPAGAYELSEQQAPTGYDKASPVELVVGDDGTVTVDGKEVSGATVSMIDKLSTVSVSGTKTWNDSGNQDGIRPESITVNLVKVTGVDENGTEELAKVDSLEVSEDESGDWKYEFSDLPEYDGENLIVYRVQEVVPDGYEAEVDGFNIKNTHEVYKTQAAVVKEWQDDNDRDKIRPQEITVLLKANGEDAVDVRGNKVAPVKLTADKSWSFTQSDLPKNKAGEQIKYTWVEVEDSIPAGYSAEIPETEVNENGIAVTKLVNVHEISTTSVSVRKQWDDDGNRDGKRPESLKLKLLANGEAAYYASGELVRAVELDEDNEWSATVDNLLLNEDGEAIVYTWEEDEDQLDKIGYHLSSPVPNEAAEEADELDPNATVLVNSYTPEETVAIVTKVWADENDWDGMRPEAIKLQLMADDSLAKDFEGNDIGIIEVTEGKGGVWSARVEGLPKYANRGEEIKYTWIEVDEPEGYDLTSSITEGLETVITNSHVVEKTQATVKKEWLDADAADGLRPLTLAATITGMVDDSDSPVYSKTVQLDESNSWMAIVEDLPVSKAGQDITYSWSEPKVEHYLAGSQIVDGTQTTLVNALVTDASVTKKWVVPEGSEPPESLNVTLMASAGDADAAVARDVLGEEVPVGVLAESNEWTYEVSGLPKYNADGLEIEYSWVEDSDALPIGFRLTNTDIEGPLTTLTNTLASAKLSFDKYYYGASADAFDFKLTPVEGNPGDTYYVDADGVAQKIDGSVVMQNGAFADNKASVEFDLVFTEDGSYTFSVVEAEDSTGTLKTDEALYVVTVEVEDGAVVGSPVYAMYYPDESGAYQSLGEVASPAFYNNDLDTSGATMRFRSMSMQGYTDSDERVSVYPEVMKYLNDSTDRLVGGDFTFELRDARGNLVAAKSNDELGRVAFFDEADSTEAQLGLVFDEPGTYTYAISERVGTESGVTYDSSVITLTVEVTADEATGILSATTTYADESGAVLAEPAFHNQREGMDLRVRKVSREGGEGLAGCTYALWMVGPAGDVMLQEAVSDDDGWILFEDAPLMQGQKYYFREVEAPSGHVVDPYRTAYFSLNADGTGTVVVEETAADGWHSRYDAD